MALTQSKLFHFSLFNFQFPLHFSLLIFYFSFSLRPPVVLPFSRSRAHLQLAFRSPTAPLILGDLWATCGHLKPASCPAERWVNEGSSVGALKVILFGDSISRIRELENFLLCAMEKVDICIEWMRIREFDGSGGRIELFKRTISFVLEFV